MKSKITFLFLFLNGHIFSQTISLDQSVEAELYSIKYPSFWSVNETPAKKTKLVLWTDAVVGQFLSNINLMVHNLEGMNLDLDGYTNKSLEQINLKGKLISSNRKTNNNIQFHEVVFEMPYENYELRYMQYYFVKDTKAYVLTYTTTIDKYESLIGEAQQIMNSFSLK